MKSCSFHCYFFVIVAVIVTVVGVVVVAVVVGSGGGNGGGDGGVGGVVDIQFLTFHCQKSRNVYFKKNLEGGTDRLTDGRTDGLLHG